MSSARTNPPGTEELSTGGVHSLLLPVSRTTYVLFGLTCLFSLLDLTGWLSSYVWGHGNLYGLVALFDLDAEKNAPSTFSTLVFLSCSLLCGLHAHTSRAARDARAWKGLAFVLCFLALDEFFSFHEALGGPVRNFLQTSGAFYLAWYIPYGIAFGVLALCYLPFFLRLDRKLQKGLALAVTVHVGGAVGLEMITALFVEARYLTSEPVCFALKNAEETLEMLGLVLAFRSLTQALALRSVGFVVEYPEREKTEASSAP